MNKTCFETDGFLSPDIENERAKIRIDFASILNEAEAASRAATMQIFQNKPCGSKINVFFGLAFWGQCISSCQASILLAERGMGLDALTVLRSAYESLFQCAALLKKPNVLNRLRDNDTIERRKQANKLLRLAGLSPDDKTELETFLETTPEPKRNFSIYDAAVEAGLADTYNVIYRGLSLKAAHPSVTTIEHIIDGCPPRLNFGSSHNNLGMAFGLARDCLNLGRGIIEAIEAID